MAGSFAGLLRRGRMLMLLATMGVPALTPAAFANKPVEISAADRTFFERDVRPVLVAKCQSCHAADKQKGNLRLDSRDFMVTGGESGPAVVPGKPEESLLIEAIRHESLEMPPDGKLTDAEIAALTEWVKRGAPWPAGDVVKAGSHRPGVITDEDRAWWAFQPLPDDVATVITDAHALAGRVDARMEAKRQAASFPFPAAESADRPTLIRRATLDLTGLPPSYDDVKAFVADDQPDAYARLVDRLLASPQYAERQARFWLDLVRYADSDGYRLDSYRSNAWRYRDYVISSFAIDKPYDRFVQEQIAGDELFPNEPQAMIATGYLRHGIYEYNSRDARTQHELILDDITDTTGDVFLGMGMQCARCHDHKFDPILQKDYFRLRAFFAGLKEYEDLPVPTVAEQAAFDEANRVWEAETAGIREKIAAIEQKYRDEGEKVASGRFPADIKEILKKPVAERTILEKQLGALAFRQVEYEWDHLDGRLKGTDKEQVIALRKELAKFDAKKPQPLPCAMCVTDWSGDCADVVIPRKGKVPVEPGYLTILDPETAAISPIDTPRGPSSGRRAALARWLTSPTNPLTARVMVNRIWQQHFGRGLAPNASDFGRLGGPPSHPELLDDLARSFIANGWRLKPIHRGIVLSETYRRACAHPQLAAAQLVDPENTLYWRGCLRRLDAEQFRDGVYAVTGELASSKTGGPGFAGESPVRSIYLRTLRNTRNPLLDAFDSPFWITSSASRHITTTPVQALLLINGQWSTQRATALATRVRKSLSTGDETGTAAAIGKAYELALGRAPSPDEIQTATDFIKAQTKAVDLQLAASEEAGFLHEKLPFRDGQAAVISNRQAPLAGPVMPLAEGSDFTIEACFLVRSVAETGAVRTIAAAWTGDLKTPGWNFGITGKASRRKPQTLVMQMVGKDAKGNLREAAIFSDQHITLNQPYYAAAAVTLAREGKPGRVTFFLKDLANEEEPLLTADVPHDLAGNLDGNRPLTLGGFSPQATSRFDGLLDDVRFTSSALTPAQLLLTTDAPMPQTLGLWRFEQTPNPFVDCSGHGHDLQGFAKRGSAAPTTASASFVDFCHVLLNSSEFLYIP